MNMDILAILMVAFGLFAILLFILFYIYARNARNKKRETEDYEELEEYKNIDKDYDNLVDEDIDKDDIKEMHLETDNVDDFKDDGSIRGAGVIVASPQEKTNYNSSEEREIEEFVPRRKK